MPQDATRVFPPLRLDSEALMGLSLSPLLRKGRKKKKQLIVSASQTVVVWTLCFNFPVVRVCECAGIVSQPAVLASMRWRTGSNRGCSGI